MHPPTIDVSAPELGGPGLHRQLHAIREAAPVAWVPSLDRYLVTSYELVVEALRSPEVFTVDDPRFTTAQVVGPSMLSLDGPQHRRHRDPFSAAFRRSRTVNQYQPIIAALVAELVDQLPLGVGGTDRPSSGSGQVDLQSSVAGPLAVGTIRAILGLEHIAVPDLLSWYNDIVRAVEALTVPDDNTAGWVPQGRRAYDRLAAAIQEVSVDPESPIGAMVTGQDLGDHEVASNAAVTLFGAIETSEAMTANLFFHLLRPADGAAHGDLGRSSPTGGTDHARQPVRVWDTLLRAANRAGVIENAVEESLRLEPAAAVVDRYTTTDVRLGGYELPERAAVALSLAAANRDPLQFPTPDRFDLERANASQQLAFVVGAHPRIGLHVARLESAMALDALLEAAPTMRLVSPEAAVPTGLVFRKPQAVLVAL